MIMRLLKVGAPAILLLFAPTMLSVHAVNRSSANVQALSDGCNDRQVGGSEKRRQTAGQLDCSIRDGLADEVLWSADHETGDLSQWEAFPGQDTSHDSGRCFRPDKGVSDEVVYSGDYALKMTIDSSFQNPSNGNYSGCREFRYPEVSSGAPLYYSAWYYLPERYEASDNHFAMLGQFKAKSENGTVNDPTWSYQIRNRDNGAMYLTLVWDGIMEGPFPGDGPYSGRKVYTQTITNIPVGRWFHIEVFLKQAADFNGRITVWQDGVEIFDFANVKTKYPNTFHTWSVTAYGYRIDPSWFTVYVDDAMIGTERNSSPPDRDRTVFLPAITSD